MKGDNYRELIQEKMSNQHYLVKTLDVINSGQPAKAIFVSLFAMIALYVRASFNISYDSVLLSLVLYLIVIFFLMMLFYFLNR